MEPTAVDMKNKVEDWIPTRHSLLSRLRDWDDKESWEVFFNTYWKLIYNVALQSGLTEVEAQEVVQETVITVAKQIPQFRYDPGKGSFKGWLLKTTQWRISDQFRKRCGDGPLAFDEATSDTTPGNPPREQPPSFGFESGWDELWQENLLEVAMERVKERVDPREFQMFEMLVERDWPPLKVAQKLNVTRAHVYYARHKISRLIRKEMERLERLERGSVRAWKSGSVKAGHLGSGLNQLNQLNQVNRVRTRTLCESQRDSGPKPRIAAKP